MMLKGLCYNEAFKCDKKENVYYIYTRDDAKNFNLIIKSLAKVSRKSDSNNKMFPEIILILFTLHFVSS